MKRIAGLMTAAMLMMGLTVMAKDVTKTFKVSGNCGMCQEKIEKAAKDAGATKAKWNKDSKTMKVSFDAKKTSEVKIKKSIAASGYDADGIKATEEAYNKLHGCCQYSREGEEKEEHKH